MESFKIEYNVPVENHYTERAVGHIASLGSRLATVAGHSAILAYSKVFDSIYDTHYTEELSDQFNS